MKDIKNKYIKKRIENKFLTNGRLAKIAANLRCTDFALLTAPQKMLDDLASGDLSVLKICYIPNSAKYSHQVKVPSTLMDEEQSLILEEAYKNRVEYFDLSGEKMHQSSTNPYLIYRRDQPDIRLPVIYYKGEKYVRLHDIELLFTSIDTEKLNGDNGLKEYFNETFFERLYKKRTYCRENEESDYHLPMWFKVDTIEFEKDKNGHFHIGPIITFNNLFIEGPWGSDYHYNDLYFYPIYFPKNQEIRYLKTDASLDDMTPLPEVINMILNPPKEAKTKDEAQIMADSKKHTEELEDKKREIEKKKKYNEIVALISALDLALKGFNDLSSTGTENLLHNIKIDPDILFIEEDEHLEIDPIFRNSSILKFFDLRNFLWDNVNLAGLDISETNIRGIDPQKVYRRDLSNCKFSDNNGFGAFTNFDGVNLCGTDFSECNEFVNLSGAITDENTIFQNEPIKRMEKQKCIKSV